MLKKSILIILIVTLITSFGLTGCKNSKDGNVGNSDTDSSSDLSNSEQVKDNDENMYAMPWAGEPIEISYFGPDYRTAEKQFDKLIDEKLAEMLGNITIKYNYFPEDEWDSVMNIAMNTQDLSDINLLKGNPNSNVVKYGDSRACLDFSKYLDYMPNYASDGSLYTLTFGKKDDQILFLDPNIGYNDNFTFNMTINTLWRDKYGIKDPTTMDELLENLRKVKQIKPDVTSALTVFPGGRIFEQLAPSFLGTGIDEITETVVNVAYDWRKNDKWYYPLYETAFKDMVELAHTIYSEGLIARDYVSQSWDKFVKNLYNDPYGWYVLGEWDMFSDTTLVEGKKVDPQFGVDFILFPTTSYITKHVLLPTTAKGSNAFYCVAANANTKNPELVCSLIDYLHGPEVSELLSFGIEGKTFKRVEPGTAPFGTDCIFLPELKVGYGSLTGTVDPKAEYGLICTDSQRKQFGILAGMWHNMGFQAQLQASMTSPEMWGWYKKYYDYASKNPDMIKPPSVVPELSSDEGERVNEIYTAANTLIAKNLTLFITGKRPMSEWDKFIQEVKNNGVGDPQEIADIYNSKPKIKIIAD